MSIELSETDLTSWLKSTQREVRSVGHGKAARLRRHFDASPERLWAACTDRDQLRRWFADVAGDLQEGAILTFDVGAPCKVRSQILRCEPSHRLLLTWSYPGREIDEVELLLTAGGAGTVVELEHRSDDKAEWWFGAGSGWEYALIKLSVLLRGGDPGKVSAEACDQQLGRLWTEAGRSCV